MRWWDSNQKVSPWATPAEFHVAPGDVDSEFSPGWIGEPAAGRSAQNGVANLFRSTVVVPKGVVRANLYICGLGYSYATINGQAAGANLLTTAPWSNNERRSGFSSFNVTSLLYEGSTNVIGVQLGAGWRDLTAFPRHDPDGANSDPTWRVVAAELHLLLSTGDEKIATTTGDGTWMMASGPVIYDSVYVSAYITLRM